MALVVTMGKRRRVGKNIVHSFALAFDSSYPSGGEALPSSLRGDGLNGGSVELVTVKPDATHFYLYDKVADKVAAWTSAAEVADTTDLSAKVGVKLQAFALR